MGPAKRPVGSLGAKPAKTPKQSDAARPAQAVFTPAKPTAKSLPGAKKVADAKARAKPAAGPKPPAQPPQNKPRPRERPQWEPAEEALEVEPEPVEPVVPVKEPAKPRLGQPSPGQSKSTKSKPKSRPAPPKLAPAVQARSTPPQPPQPPRLARPARPARPPPKRKPEPPEEPEPQKSETDWQEETEKWDEPWEEETWEPAKPARQPRPSGPKPPVHPPTRPSVRRQPAAPVPSALPAKAPPGRQPSWPSKPSSIRPVRPTESTASTGSTAYAPEQAEPEPEKSRPVAWISVPDDSALVQQGYYNQAPVVQHEAEYQELLSDSHDILYTLAESTYEDITFQHDHDWTLFPEVGQCAKDLGYGDWALCLAICPSQSIFAVGVGGQQKKRMQAARLAMSVALAAMQNTSDKKLRDAFQRSPAFVEFCQTAEVNVEDSVPSHPALTSQRHANRKWSKKSQGQVEQSEQSEQAEQVEQWNSEGNEAAEWRNESWGNGSWDNGSWDNGSWGNGSWGNSTEKQWKNSGRNQDAEETSAYEAQEPEANKAYGEEVEQEAEEEIDETQAIEKLISQAEEEAKKISEEEFDEKMDEIQAEAADEWKQDELQEPEPEAQEAPEVPGEGDQEEEFEEVFEELEEDQQAQQEAMEDTQQAEPEEDVQPPPSKRQRQETQSEPLKRETPHWLYVDQLPEKLQGFSNETLVLASDGSCKKAMYSQADKALEAMIGDLAKEVICDDDPSSKKFPEVAEELKLLADQQECFTLAISPTRCLWGVGVSMRGVARRQAAKLALAVLVALQMAEIGEDIPDLSMTPAVADFLEEAQAAKDDLLHSSIRGKT